MDKAVGTLLKNPVFIAVLGILALYLFYTVRLIVMILLLAFILAIALHPAVKWLERHKVPSVLAVIMTVLSSVGAIGGLIYLIVRGMADQADTVSDAISSALATLPLGDDLPFELSPQQLFEQAVGNVGAIAQTFATTVVALIAGVLTVAVLTIYWLVDYDRIKSYIISRFYDTKRATKAYAAIERGLGAWFRGQLLISVIVGCLSYVVFRMLGQPGATALAIIASFLEIVPTLGPILAAIPAILIGLTISVQTALLAMLASIIIQQIESHVIAPKVLQYTVKIHPLAVITVLYIGGTLAGLMGILLAVPVTLFIMGLVQGFAPRNAVASDGHTDKPG